MSAQVYHLDACMQNKLANGKGRPKLENASPSKAANCVLTTGKTTASSGRATNCVFLTGRGLQRENVN